MEEMWIASWKRLDIYYLIIKGLVVCIDIVAGAVSFFGSFVGSFLSVFFWTV